MGKPIEYQVLPECNNKIPRRVTGGYSLDKQEPVKDTSQQWSWIFGGHIIGFYVAVLIVGAMSRGSAVSVVIAIFLASFGCFYLYFIVIKPKLLALPWCQSFFAINDWPLEVGQSYGFSFYQPLKDRTLAAGSNMTVVFSYARVNSYGGQMVWQEQHEFPQQAGDTAFWAQWIMTVPAGFAPSRDFGKRRLEWQVAIHLQSTGLPTRILQYKLQTV
jgi:hypothetical protein